MIDGFLDAVCAEVRWSRWKAPIRAELRAHIEDRIDYLTVHRGFTPEEAEFEAISAMGNPIDIGRALNKEHRASYEYAYRTLVIACSAIVLYLFFKFL